MPEAFLSQLTASAIVVYLIQTLKKSPYVPWLTMESKRAARILSGLGAALSAFGVHAAMSGDASAGWSVTITIPSVVTLIHAGWDWVEQMALNQLVFDGVVSKPPKASA